MLLHMYVLSNISKTWLMASSVDYIISRMSRPFWKVCPCVLVHKMPKIFIWNASLKLNSHHLPWKRQSTYKPRNSIQLRYVNKIMTEMMLTSVLVPLILRLHVQPLLSKLDFHSKVWPITLILKMNISGLLYATYLVLLINRNNIEFNCNQILALLIET